MKPLASKANKILQVKPRLGQGRAGIKHKKASNYSTNCSISEKPTAKIPEIPKIWKQVINIQNIATPVQSISNPSTKVINRRTMQKISKDIPFYQESLYRLPPKPVKIPMPGIPRNMDINPKLNTNFEEISIPRGCNTGNIPKAR